MKCNKYTWVHVKRVNVSMTL
ncbi:tetracycline resistance efflux system leader peptide [Lysinibacillus cavernae]